MAKTQFLPSIFKRYDRVRIINLLERTDRRADMLREIQRLRLDHHRSIGFIHAIKREDPGPFLKVGSHGAFDSYMAVLREASESEASVLVLQDDCRFLRSVNDKIDLAAVDIFYGGWKKLGRGSLENSGIIGAHCMGFSARAARLAFEYLSDYKSPGFSADPIAAQQSDYDPNIRPPIDGALVWFRRAHPELRVMFHRIATQRSSWSSISPRSSVMSNIKARVSSFIG